MDNGYLKIMGGKKKTCVLCTRQKQGLTLDFQLDPSHTPVHNGTKDFLCLLLKHFDKIDAEIQNTVRIVYTNSSPQLKLALL